jgi:hypothetical protein
VSETVSDYPLRELLQKQCGIGIDWFIHWDLTSSPFIAYIVSDSLGVYITLLHYKVKRYAEWFIKSLSNPFRMGCRKPSNQKKVKQNTGKKLMHSAVIYKNKFEL